MNNSKLLLPLSLLAASFVSEAARVAYFPMDLENGNVREAVSGASFRVYAAARPEAVDGIKGSALRLDGYSNYVEADLSLADLKSFTFSLWCAMETWPIIEHDIQNESDFACIAGNYDPESKSGMGFFVNRVGKVVFRFYSQGWPCELAAPDPLPLYKWNSLAAVSDGSEVAFYLNGKKMGAMKSKGISSGSKFMIGKSRESRMFDSFHVNSVNGIIDEVEILDQPLDAAVIQGWSSSEAPGLCSVAADRFADDILRPRFHGMPSRNWTNETHGLVRYNDRFHLFFQKNANGPYMSRLQWGHIVSDDLCNWQELPIAIGSDMWYDLKGCWSGCVAVDDVVTGGVPNIIYTGVDYARAMIGQASPLDDNLISWRKPVNPIIDGRPAGLSDDFRDPYFFRNGNDAYIVVGTSKDGLGACTLHKYNTSTRSWSNDGRIFFKASSAAGEGSFWEMPAVIPMDGKHMFLATPLGINTGVKAVYWTGSINADGSFASASKSSPVELPGFARQGYGLLSPSVTQIDGKTIAIGIVPDKLPGFQNYLLGWAHTYSLPREWSLDADGRLIQKPYSGLTAMRDKTSELSFDRNLNGSESLGEMPSRQAELIGEFMVADTPFGFSLFRNDDNELKISYTPSNGKFSVDMRGLKRIVNDEGSFNGLYSSALPVPVEKGSVMKIHIFVDHSILDIFINDKWASSVRVFPTDATADGMEVFSEGGATRAKVSRWILSSAPSSVEEITTDDMPDGDMPDGLTPSSHPAEVDIYTIDGRLIKRAVDSRTDPRALSLSPGLYLFGTRKILLN